MFRQSNLTLVILLAATLLRIVPVALADSRDADFYVAIDGNEIAREDGE